MMNYKIFLFLFFFSVATLQAGNVKSIYVSTSGSDLNVGTRNRPFKSIEKARDEIRKLKRENTQQSFRVVIFGGKYFVDKPIIFTAEDSGADKSTIVYEAMKGETVRIIGGIEVLPSAFSPLAENDPVYHRISVLVRNKIKVLDLDKAGITDPGKFRRRGYSYRNEPSPMELSINSKNMQLARWPNSGYAKSGEAVDRTGFFYTTNIPDKWKEEKDAWTLGYWRVGWAEIYSRIESIDSVNNIIKIANQSNSKNSSLTTIKNHRNWCGINILAELDIPGEYYIDREHQRLYVYPPDGVDFQSSEIMLSMLGENGRSIIEASGLKNVTFRNIILEKSRFGALSANDCENIMIDGCRFKNTGNTSVMLSGKNIKLLNSEIFDSGAGGLIVGGGDRNKLVSGNIVVENCHIHHFGIWNRTYTPGIRISGVGTTVRNCRLNDGPHSAILFGGNNHLIEFNDFYDTCFETDDSGTIYAGRDWALHGTVIRYNYIHDISSNASTGEAEAHELGVHGIYLDDCASGLTMYGNIFNNISGRAIMCGGGRHNIIDNNIIVNCGAAHFTDRRGLKRITDIPGDSWNLREKVQSLNFTQPPFSTAFPKLATLMDEGYEKAKEPVGCEITNNIGFNNKVWLEKNCSGACGGFDFYHFEGNLESSDPMFVDETDLLKGVSKKSPVYSMKGFKEIPFDKIGLKNK
jgi:hypothetical protein